MDIRSWCLGKPTLEAQALVRERTSDSPALLEMSATPQSFGKVPTSDANYEVQRVAGGATPVKSTSEIYSNGVI